MDTLTPPAGRRDRKKAATRRAIADAALSLFLERGYDAVSIKDIADAADVSTTTVFKHFQSKEALVFDEDAANEGRLIAAVKGGSTLQGVVSALRKHTTESWQALQAQPNLLPFLHLVDATPALKRYQELMWTRHTDALAQAMSVELGLPNDDIGCVAVARFILDIPTLTRGRTGSANADIQSIFDIIDKGWSASGKGKTARHGK